ncbi:MAG: NAD(+)/NADH kinase [Acidimicrobiia bacterium]
MRDSVVRRIRLVLHETKPEAKEVADRVVAGAAARDLEIATDESVEVDLIIGIGGDGTLLTAASQAIVARAPVVGINLGRVGYLADVEPDQVDAMLDGLVAGTLQRSERMTVRATVGAVETLGINDVVLEKVMSQRLVQLRVEINGEYFTTYRSDGIIVASPLGSTAYSLSAGGPVLDPSLDALILTPVAPHSLMSRSIVLAPDALITCTVEIDREVRLSVDGRDSGVLAPGSRLTIDRGPRAISFLTLGGYPFPQPVRHQFGLDHA